MSLNSFAASVSTFISHRIVRASFISILLLVVTLLVIMYLQDLTNVNKNVTAAIVGILWIISSYNVFSIETKEKEKTYKQVYTATVDGLNLSNNMINALHTHKSLDANASTTTRTVMNDTTKLEETAVLATVTAKVVKDIALASGASMSEAKEESEHAINKIINQSDQSEINKQVLKQSFNDNKDKLQQLFNSKPRAGPNQ